MDNEYGYVLSFDSTSHALQTEKQIKEYFDIAIIPTPREISFSCGLSIKINSLDIDKIKDFIDTLKVPFGLYRLSSHRFGQKKEIQQIASNREAF